MSRIKSAVVFRDLNDEEHICHKTGRKKEVTISCTDFSKDHRILYAVLKATGNAFLTSNTLVKQCQHTDIYFVKIASAYYFVKALTDTDFIIVYSNYSLSGFGEGVANSSWAIWAYQEDDITVFAFFDEITKKRTSNYYYIQW